MACEGVWAQETCHKKAENDTTFDGQSGGCKPYMFLKQVFSCVYLKLLFSP
jgi:hypothetical protein